MRMRLVLQGAEADGIENVVIRTDANEGCTRGRHGGYGHVKGTEKPAGLFKQLKLPGRLP